MARLKQTAALLISLMMIISMAGCGKNTTWAMDIDGYQVKAGIYIYFSYNMYQEALSKIGGDSSEQSIDTSDEKAIKKATIENKTVMQWVQDETVTRLKQFVANEKEFDKLGLSLTDDQKTEIQAYLDNYMDGDNGKLFKKNGISEDSIKAIITNSYKSEAVFKAYYGIDGSEGVTEQQLKDYYIENNARVKYIDVALKDGNGNLLEGDDKQKVIDMAKSYLERLQNGEDFDTIKDEYTAYSESVSEEAAAATGTDENGETTTKSETTTSETEETTVSGDDSLSESNETVSGDVSESEETETTENSGEAETTDTTDITETEETTTADPYANETIIAKVTTADPDETTEDGESTETTTEPTYSPSKKSYDAIFDQTKYGVPFMVDDEESYYIIIKYDIEERMTSDDLWTDTQIDTVDYTIFYKDYEDKVNSWSDALTVNLNKKALDRYDPADYKES